MNWKQFLTEKVLKECWHEFVVAFPPVEPEQIPVRGHKCKHCGKYWPTKIRDGHGSRTFDNRNDMMDLYEKIEKDGKWDDFFWDFAFKRKPENYGLGEAETSVWLFCLDGKDYEAQCKMVAEFYGWKADHD